MFKPGDVDRSLARDEHPQTVAARKSDKLTAALRTYIKEMLNEKEIKDAIKARVKEELEGKVDMHLTTTLLKLVAPVPRPRTKKLPGGPNVAGDLNVNVFAGWTPEELLMYSISGKIPERTVVQPFPKKEIQG